MLTKLTAPRREAQGHTKAFQTGDNLITQTPESIRFTDARSLSMQLLAETRLLETVLMRSDRQRRFIAFYTFLIEAAFHIVEKQERSPLPTVTFGYIGEILAALLGMSRTTMYSYLNTLSEFGLVAYKGRVVTVQVNGKGSARCDGSVMCVSLTSSSEANYVDMISNPFETWNKT